MRIAAQRAVWNKFGDDQKFQLFVEMTDALESVDMLCCLPDEEDMYWDHTGERISETPVKYSVYDLSRL